MDAQQETADVSAPVLVTGGTGYLARWCIHELLGRGYTVHTTVRDLSREAALRSLFPAADGNTRLRVFAADLLRDDGWQKAADGCGHVLHVASPLPPSEPKNADELIVPARDGTMRVLRAAFDGGARRRRPGRCLAGRRDPPATPFSTAPAPSSPSVPPTPRRNPRQRDEARCYAAVRVLD